MSVPRKYRFGDYCLEPMKSFVKSYESFKELYEIIKEVKRHDVRERILKHFENTIKSIELCINEAECLKTTLSLIGERFDTVTIKELDENIVKMQEIKIDIKHHLLVKQ